MPGIPIVPRRRDLQVQMNPFAASFICIKLAGATIVHQTLISILDNMEGLFCLAVWRIIKLGCGHSRDLERPLGRVKAGLILGNAVAPV